MDIKAALVVHIPKSLSLFWNFFGSCRSGYSARRTESNGQVDETILTVPLVLTT